MPYTSQNQSPLSSPDTTKKRKRAQVEILNSEVVPDPFFPLTKKDINAIYSSDNLLVIELSENPTSQQRVGLSKTISHYGSQFSNNFLCHANKQFLFMLNCSSTPIYEKIQRLNIPFLALDESIMEKIKKCKTERGKFKEAIQRELAKFPNLTIKNIYQKKSRISSGHTDDFSAASSKRNKTAPTKNSNKFYIDYVSPLSLLSSDVDSTYSYKGMIIIKLTKNLEQDDLLTEKFIQRLDNLYKLKFNRAPQVCRLEIIANYIFISEEQAPEILADLKQLDLPLPNILSQAQLEEVQAVTGPILQEKAKATELSANLSFTLFSPARVAESSAEENNVCDSSPNEENQETNFDFSKALDLAFNIDQDLIEEWVKNLR